MSSPPHSHFAIEGGKFFLAEALFHSFKYNIRCSHCVGNRSQPGFIKDQGGKVGNNQARRQWACQRSNGRGITSKCPRASCTEYIDLAIDQLDRTQVLKVVAQVCHQYPPDREEYAHLQAYQPELEGGSVNTPLEQQRPEKRKAVDDLKTPNVKTARCVSHPRLQDARLFQAGAALQSAVEPLQALVRMSQTWGEQLELLQTLLASRLDSLFIPSDPTSSASIRTHVSSTTAPSSSPFSSFHNTEPPLPIPSSPLCQPIRPDQQSDLDVAIPSTHLEERVEVILSSPTPSTNQGIEGAKCLSQLALDRHPLKPIKPSPSPAVRHSVDPYNIVVEDTSPSSKAKLLARQFRQASKIKRVDIRMRAREEGIYSLLQRYLSYQETL
jgi:hypothetical protein